MKKKDQHCNSRTLYLKFFLLGWTCVWSWHGEPNFFVHAVRMAYVVSWIGPNKLQIKPDRNACWKGAGTHDILPLIAEDLIYSGVIISTYEEIQERENSYNVEGTDLLEEMIRWPRPMKSLLIGETSGAAWMTGIIYLDVKFVLRPWIRWASSFEYWLLFSERAWGATLVSVIN